MGCGKEAVLRTRDPRRCTYRLPVRIFRGGASFEFVFVQVEGGCVARSCVSSVHFGFLFQGRTCLACTDLFTRQQSGSALSWKCLVFLQS